jgi:hypothetical protein
MHKAILTALIALLIARLISEMLLITRRRYRSLLNFASFVDGFRALRKPAPPALEFVAVDLAETKSRWFDDAQARMISFRRGVAPRFSRIATHMRVARRQDMSSVASREEVICDLTPVLAVSAPGVDVSTSG